ncbi:helix-turn-helix domain-containing protein [Tropicibacter oceani]|uniref:Helix-turn-helix domain-containing protein n=1 Tax=Tropicibacter oceani TaxID=3058420 RepID=A0ABY8QGA3_9RHOB|nr:helix-turn-helix domain-containing protein [Tropicibacter oceani]WGW03650.1 helix-turn-helix domain-containing protein [Tropicibacter oceani]
MAKRLDPRRLRAVLTYDVPELARALGVTQGTVRAMIRRGLPTLNSQRPTLILGSAAKAYIEVANVQARSPLEPDQLFCLTCKAPRHPWGGMVDLVRTRRAPRIEGLCEVCEGKCSRVVSAAKIPEIARIFDLATSDGK